MADIVQDTNVAVATILNADSGIQTITGRTTGNIRPWRHVADENLPILLYNFTVGTEEGGSGDNRFLQYQIAAFAEGPNAGSVVNNLLERVELGLTEPLLSAQGLDAAPMRRTRTAVVIERDGTRELTRGDIDVEIWATKP
jgi:hypothetical protein